MPANLFRLTTTQVHALAPLQRHSHPGLDGVAVFAATRPGQSAAMRVPADATRLRNVAALIDRWWINNDEVDAADRADWQRLRDGIVEAADDTIYTLPAAKESN